jgi:hypothetical protein
LQTPACIAAVMSGCQRMREVSVRRVVCGSILLRVLVAVRVGCKGGSRYVATIVLRLTYGPARV